MLNIRSYEEPTPENSLQAEVEEDSTRKLFETLYGKDTPAYHQAMADFKKRIGTASNSEITNNPFLDPKLNPPLFNTEPMPIVPQNIDYNSSALPPNEETPLLGAEYGTPKKRFACGSGTSSWRKATQNSVKFLFRFSLYSGIFAGTTAALSPILATLVTLMNHPDVPDEHIYDDVFWGSLVASALVAFKTTADFSRLYAEHFTVPEANFDEWLDEKLPSVSSLLKKSANYSKTIITAAAFGTTGIYAACAIAAPNPHNERYIAGGLTALGIVLAASPSFVKQAPPTYGELEVQGFKNKQVLATSLLTNIPTVSTFIMFSLWLLQTPKMQHELSARQQQDCYIAIIIFGLLALYYFFRMTYENKVALGHAQNVGIVSSIGKLINKLKNAYKNCIPDDRRKKYVDPVIKAFLTAYRTIVIGGVSAGLVYNMWIAWRMACIQLGFFKEDTLTPYPLANTFDLSMLLTIGLGNIIMFFLQFNTTANHMDHNDTFTGSLF